jgi:hypothetical protein
MDLLESQRFDEGTQVVGEVSDPPRGVEGHRLGVAEPTQVWGQPAVAWRQDGQRVLEKARGGGVAVDEEDGGTTLRSAPQEVRLEPGSRDDLRTHAF